MIECLIVMMMESKLHETLVFSKIHTFFLNTLTGCKNVMFAKIFDSLCLC